MGGAALRADADALQGYFFPGKQFLFRKDSPCQQVPAVYGAYTGEHPETDWQRARCSCA